MPTGIAPKNKKKKRRIVKGIEHGLSGYTNYACKCDVCTEANRTHHEEYRAKRFAGSPLCIFPKCPRVQSRAYGNGLCYKHAQEWVHLRKNHPIKAKRVAQKLGITLRRVAA